MIIKLTGDMNKYNIYKKYYQYNYKHIIVQ